MDWHHPDYRPRRAWEYPNPNEGGDNRRYVAFMKEQLRELLTGYGDVAMIWFDGEWEHTLRDLHMDDDVYDFIRKLQPNTLINDRLYERKPGNRADFGTPEQFVPATGVRSPDGKPVLWEACVTINNDSWGYNKYETDFKTTRDLIRMLIEVVSKGGNLLLNVGPKPDGTIQPEFTTRLAAMGDWLKVNNESIYGTTASPFEKLPFFGRATVKGDELYLHVFQWPRDGKLRVPGLKNEIRSGRILGVAGVAGSKVSASRDGDDWIVQLPPAAPNDIASVVALKLNGPPQVIASPLRPTADGVLSLGAESAEIESNLGQRAKKENMLDHVFITRWTRSDDVLAWDFSLPKAGHYKVEASYGARGTAVGKSLQLESGAARLSGDVQQTGGEFVFKPYSLGEVDLPAGRQSLRLKAAERASLEGLNFEKLTLTLVR
jgi:alpha-L-fucosidase